MLINNGFIKPSVLNSKGLSMELNLNKNWKEKINRSWKRSINKFKHSKFKIIHEKEIDPLEIFHIYRQLEIKKKIHQQFSLMQIKTIIKNFDKQLVHFKCVDINQKIICIRTAIVVGQNAWDLFAANIDTKDSIGVSHNVFVHLLEHCQTNGVVKYDLSGIDPDKNIGVYNFKKGSGARIVEYFGEYEQSNSVFLKLFFNLLLRLSKIFK